MLLALPSQLYSLFLRNLSPLDPVLILLFILLIILVGSIASTLAPSSTDLKNGAVGIVILGILGLAVAHYKPLAVVLDAEERFDTATPALDLLVTWLGAGVNIGMFACLVMLVIVIPFRLLKGSR
jgi:uncharacterized membrane protein YeaQ/YmgE (transglycosylase-associated protein family)